MPGIGLPELIILLFLFVPMVMGTVAGWFIFSKAGFPGWISLVFWIPIFGWLIIFYLAFAQWPVLKELEELRKTAAKEI